MSRYQDVNKLKKCFPKLMNVLSLNCEDDVFGVATSNEKL